MATAPNSSREAQASSLKFSSPAHKYGTYRLFVVRLLLGEGDDTQLQLPIFTNLLAVESACIITIDSLELWRM